MKRSSLFAKIAAVTSMLTTMAILVAFKAGAFDTYVADNFIDGEPDSTKKDTVMMDDYILLYDSTYVIPAYVYSSKAMVMDYKLEFDTVLIDTVMYGTPRADSIARALAPKRKIKPNKFMGGSKSGMIIDPASYDNDRAQK